MNILVYCGLSKQKLISKIAPIVALKKVKKIYIIRNTPLKYKKAISFKIPFLFRVPFIREMVKLIVGFYICIFKNVDMIIGIFLVPHGLFAYLTGRLLRKPTIQLLPGRDFQYIEVFPWFSKKMFKSSLYIGVRGTHSLERIDKIINNRNKIFINNNVFSIRKLDREFTLYKKEIDVVMLGYFGRVKRIDIFLKVIKRIKNKYPNIKASIVGKDLFGRRKIYEKMRMEMGLERNVDFPGYIDNVYPYLIKAKTFLLTSEREGLPMAMIEAMSLGLPCVVPDVGDIRDVANDSFNAFVVRPLDVDAFVTKLTRLFEDEVLYKRISKNAIETIRKKEKEFSLQHNIEIWEKILL
jgi:glycosyltransferase involved in cell wall biosynthesis